MTRIDAEVPETLELRLTALREKGVEINMADLALRAVERAVAAEESRLAGRPVASILQRFSYGDDGEFCRADGERFGRRWAEQRASRRDLETVARMDRLVDFTIEGDRVEVLAGQGDTTLELPSSLEISPASFPRAFDNEWFAGLFAGARSVLELVDRASALELRLEALAAALTEGQRLTRARQARRSNASAEVVNESTLRDEMREALQEAEEMGLTVPDRVSVFRT